MKRLLSLLIAGTLIAMASFLLLGQVPASFLRSNLTLSGQAQSSNTLGTAVFTAAGSIGSLYKSGSVSGVTYSTTGTYAVTLTGSPTNYVVTAIAEQSAPAGSLLCFLSIANGTRLASGFTLVNTCVNPVEVADPASVTLTVTKQ